MRRQSHRCLPNGETSIRGFYWGGAISAAPYKPPAFCHDCGEPYPWTKAALEAAEELIRFNEDLSDEEKSDFLEALKETTRDTPKARVAAEKMKRYGKKLGTEAMKTLREILTDIASEVVKKSMGL